jgi:probable HAF family extracellular repeat protein
LIHGTNAASYSDGRAINGREDVALVARSTSGYDHAFLYSGGAVTDLGALGTNSYPTAINASRQVVGLAYTANCYHAFRATTSGMQDLGTLGGSLQPGNGHQ